MRYIISYKKLIAENFNEHFINLKPDLAREFPSTKFKTLHLCESKHLM